MSAAVARAGPRSVSRIMATVLVALLPALIARTVQESGLFLINVATAVFSGLLLEGIMLRLRRQPQKKFLGDLSAPLTAVLLVLLLPPSLPWWALPAGMLAALGLAKHAFGGLGQNLFNPALVGAALLLLVFPKHANPADATSDGLLVSLYLAGGALLASRKIIDWPVPFCMLGGWIVSHSAVGWWHAGPASPGLILVYGTPWLFAFFIITDPVTGCLSLRGRMIFALGVGLLAPLLASTSSLTSGLVFAVLVLNCAAPLIDQHTRPRRLPRATA